MALLPDLLDEFYRMRPQRLADQHFALGLAPEDLLSIANTPTFARDYYRPWRHMVSATRDLGSHIRWDSEKLQISLDVQHFKPDEITVKAGEDYIVVKGEHEEKRDQHGYVTRQFIRRYPLPKDVLSETVESKLSSDGVLSITAAKKIPGKMKGERIVPIITNKQVQKEVLGATEQPNIAPKVDSKSSVQQDTKTQSNQDTNHFVKQDAVTYIKDHLKNNVEEIVKNSVKEDSMFSSKEVLMTSTKEGSKKSVKEDSKTSVKEDSKRTVKEELKTSAKEDSKKTVKEDSKK